jgi:hypothetical protein
MGDSERVKDNKVYESSDANFTLTRVEFSALFIPKWLIVEYFDRNK